MLSSGVVSRSKLLQVVVVIVALYGYDCSRTPVRIINGVKGSAVACMTGELVWPFEEQRLRFQAF